MCRGGAGGGEGALQDSGPQGPQRRVEKQALLPPALLLPPASPSPGSSLHTDHTQQCRAGPPALGLAGTGAGRTTSQLAMAGRGRHVLFPLSLQPYFTDWELRTKALELVSDKLEH